GACPEIHCRCAHARRGQRSLAQDQGGARSDGDRQQTTARGADCKTKNGIGSGGDLRETERKKSFRKIIFNQVSIGGFLWLFKTRRSTRTRAISPKAIARSLAKRSPLSAGKISARCSSSGKSPRPANTRNTRTPRRTAARRPPEF